MKQTAAIESAVSEADALHHASLEANQVRLLADLCEWMAPRAAALGLTRYADPLELARKLVCPTIALADPHLGCVIGTKCLDFGCGSGAMGLSLAIIAPESWVICADRRSKAVQFVDLAAHRLGIVNCQARAVDLGAPSGADSDHELVMVRAFVGGADGVSLARRWTSGGGSIALWHRPPVPAVSLPLLATLNTSLPDLQLTVYTLPGDTPSP